MTTTELAEKRTELQHWISESGEEVLSAVEMVRKSFESTPAWNDLDDVTRQLLEKGIADADAGRTMDSETFWKMMKR